MNTLAQESKNATIIGHIESATKSMALESLKPQQTSQNLNSALESLGFSNIFSEGNFTQTSDINMVTAKSTHSVDFMIEISKALLKARKQK